MLSKITFVATFDYNMRNMQSANTISGCRRNGRSHQASSLLRSLLLLLCLLATLSRASARPSDERNTALVGTTTVDKHGNSEAPVLHHHYQKRRSADEHGDDYDDEDYLRLKRCYEDEDVNELCQRCSKVTKSSIVFPMCCSNEDKTMDWCEAYVYYGIQN